MTNEQPTALRLANALETDWHHKRADHPMLDAATELRRLHAENEALQKALRRVIRTYMVADDAWDHAAELERLYQLVIKE